MAAADLQADLQLARAHHQAGRLPQAQQIYRQILARQPDQPQALYLLGVLAAQSGHHDQALELLGRAVAADPNSVEANFHFGIALLRQGRFDEAVAALSAAIGAKPGFAEAHGNLGVALANLGRVDEAIAAYRTAVQLRPDYADALSNLGSALVRRGRLDDAVAACQRAIVLRPDFTPALNNLGNALKGLRRYDQAVAAFKRAIEIEPGLAAAHSNLGGALLELGHPDQAVAAYQRAIALNPNLAMAHCNLGGALEDLGQLDAASAALHRAIALDPNLALAHCYLGGVFRAQGHLDQAQAAFRTALRLDPDMAHAHANVATLLRDKLPARDRQALEACLGHASVTGKLRATLLYALAHVLDATGDYPRAAVCLRQAHALDLEAARHRGRQYRPAEHEAFVDAIVQAFNPEFFTRTHGAGLVSRRPVFVFGLPRSGTSLVEQVLASHPQVHGAGELTFARQSFDAIPGALGRPDQPLACVPALDIPALAHLARQHLDKLDAFDHARAARIIDKMPDNYVFLGLLAALFPQATLIHCRRDLRDVGVSCWMTDFVNVPWAHDPEHMVSRFAQYRRLMNHWRTVLPVPIHEVDYEEVVGDLEGQARRLVAACGLEWDPACLDFHRTHRDVRTASGAQVRQPIYQRSVARWKNYEHELADWFARLRSCDAYGAAAPTP